MTNYGKHPLFDKIVSFIASIIIVLIIFVGIVGIVFPLMIEARIEDVKIIALVPTLIGALIIILARRWQIFRTIYFIKKARNYNTKKFDFIGSLIIGLSFLFAGVLYMRTKNPNMMIIPFIGGAAFIRIIIFYINNQIKKQDLSSTPEEKE